MTKAKTSFKKSPAELFLNAEDQQRPAWDPVEGFQVPEGYKLVPVNKTERLQLLVRPAVKSGIKEAAREMGVSMNDLANGILERWLRENREA